MRASHDSKGPPSAVDAQVRSQLQRRGLRLTGGRQAILNLLIEAQHPLSIGEIAAALPGLPRSSAYRHLADLQAAAVVRRVAASDEFARFELVEELTIHHHHLICTSCGTVIDVASSAALEQAMSQHLDHLALAHGFQPQSHRIDVLGLCLACRAPGGATIRQEPGRS